MTEEMKYYTGNCITDLHTDTSFSYCNEEKCKQYIKSDGLNFCMSSVCSEKDCIYALVNELHKTIDQLEKENKELKEKVPMKLITKNNTYRSVLEEINRTLLGVRGLSIHCDKQIIKAKAIINEVLNA